MKLEVVRTILRQCYPSPTLSRSLSVLLSLSLSAVLLLLANCNSIHSIGPERVNTSAGNYNNGDNDIHFEHLVNKSVWPTCHKNLGANAGGAELKKRAKKFNIHLRNHHAVL